MLPGQGGRLAALGQTQHALADDVVLDFVGTRRECATPRGKHPMRPFAAIYCAGRLVFKLAVWSEQLHRERLNTKVEIGSSQFQDRSFRAWRQSAQLAGQLA